jgi:hypothetical protein
VIVVLMMGFAVRLMPPRPSFPLDMTSDERATMRDHVGYRSRPALEERRIAVCGGTDPG